MNENQNCIASWLNNLPNHWEIKTFNYCIQLRQQIGNYSSDKIFLGLENIESWSGRYVETENKYLEKQSDIYCNGDILFSKLRPYLAKVYYAKEDGFCTGEFLVIKDFIGLKNYLLYILLTPSFIDLVNSSTYGTKMPRASWDFIKKLHIPLPPLDEQKIIASFLNSKCKKIDKLISLEETAITELKEYKKSIIQKAVTKGIKKGRKLKNSGIDWIGDIPEEWDIVRQKVILQKKKDICEVYKGEAILSLTMNGVIKRDLDNPSGKMPETFDGYQIVNQGNLLLCLYDIDVTPRCVGLIKDDGLTSPSYSQFIPNDNAFALYYTYLLTAIDNDKAFLHLSKNLRSTITESDFGAIPTILPPIEEQKLITKYLDKKINAVNNLISLKQQKITELKEYKKSLIYEYVTGKKQPPKKDTK